MKRNGKASEPPVYLGIEGGGTRTRIVAAGPGGAAALEFELGPANLRLIKDRDLRDLMLEIRSRAGKPAGIGVAIAGAREDRDRARVLSIAEAVWPRIPCAVTHDLESAWRAAGPLKLGGRVLVSSGTGSCCYGRTRDGRELRTGGWGHHLGDRGSAYALALQTLREVLREYDHFGRWTECGAGILRALQMNHPDELPEWIQSAPKSEVAALAREILPAAGRGDRVARRMVIEHAGELACDAVACARRLRLRPEDTEFISCGGVLENHRNFARALVKRIRRDFANAAVKRLPRPSVWGAWELARNIASPSQPAGRSATSIHKNALPARPEIPPVKSETLPTEQRNPRSLDLDRLAIPEAISLMLSEEGAVPEILRRQIAILARAIRSVTRALRRGGRLIYLGAGTSGRLGILDAGECPPTFHTPPHMVQGIIAGGRQAVWSAVEGAEDDSAAGAAAVRFRKVNRKDMVFGIAASGRTPFVWGGLLEARKAGATTGLLCFNPYLKIPRVMRPDLVLSFDVGPEVLTGSTRLKAGTATKLVLNLMTTLGMVQLGKVRSNLMVNLHPTNSKLRDRAVRIVQDLTGVDNHDARTALEKAGWDIQQACSHFNLPRPNKRQ